MRHALALLVPLLLSACSSDVVTSSGDPAPACNGPRATTGDLPLDVADVLIARCQTCHDDPPTNHAPWPLRSWEDVETPWGMTGKLRWQRMAQVIEPGVARHMPPLDQPQLSPEEVDVLRRWFQACAPPVPEGTGGDPAP